MNLLGFLLCFLNLSIASDSLESLVVKRVEVIGNKKTKESIILREMTFSVGDTLTEGVLSEKLERSRKNIFNTNLFLWCKADFDQVNGEANIIIEVRERLYLLPLPILFLADRSFNEWWYNRNHDLKRLTYGVLLNHSNLTGNADVLKAKVYGGFVPYFELSYNRPYIDKRQRMGLRAGVFYSTQKSFAYRTWDDKLDFVNTDLRTQEKKGVFVEYNLRNALYHSHKIYLGYTENKLLGEAVDLNPNYFGTAVDFLPYFTLRYNYRFEQVNNVQYPLEGQVLAASANHYGLGLSDHLHQISFVVDYQNYRHLGGDFYGNVNVKGQLSFPKKQLYPFVSALGTKRSIVRGYELNVIDGQHYGLLQTNLKYEVFNTSLDMSKVLPIKQLDNVPLALYSIVYADMGYVKNYFPELSNSTLSNKLIYGGGVGFDLVTFYSTAAKINLSVNQFGFSKVYFGVYKGI